MFNKIVGVVLILFGGFFTFVAGKAILGAPEVAKQLEEAPFITDGKVDPANEGKNIILLISPDIIGNATDDLFGITFEYPIVRREVEELKNDSDGKLNWHRIYDSDDGICDAAFFGSIGGLEYDIDSSLLKSLAATSKKLGKKDYDREKLNTCLNNYKSLHTEEYNGVLYITDTDTKYFGDCDKEKVSDSNWSDYTEEVGSIRISYRVTDTGDVDSIALIGKQIGNSIVKSDIDTIPCYENVHTREELMKKDKNTLSIGLIFGMVINIVFIVLGMLLIVGKIHLPSNNND